MNRTDFGEADTNIREHFEAAVYPINEESSFSTRALGGLKGIGGTLEMVGGAIGGVATAETGVGAVLGWAAIAHGADVAASGFTQMLTGEDNKTFTERGISAGLQTAGISPQKADEYAGYGDTMLGMALSIVTSNGRYIPKPSNAPKLVKDAVTKVDYLFKDKGDALNWARQKPGHNTAKIYNETGKLIGWENEMGTVYWGHGDWYTGPGSAAFPHLNYNINGVRGHLFLENKIVNSGLWKHSKNISPYELRTTETISG